MQNFTIGDAARAAGAKVQTIRYYEEIGLLRAPVRTAGNQRVFSAAELERLKFIRHCRALGLSLSDIRVILDLRDQPEAPCARADAIVKGHLTAVKERIRNLRLLQRELERIADKCAGGLASDCQVIEALGDHSQCLSGDHGMAAEAKI